MATVTVLADDCGLVTSSARDFAEVWSAPNRLLARDQQPVVWQPGVVLAMMVEPLNPGIKQWCSSVAAGRTATAF
jgi:hypothetical protein